MVSPCVGARRCVRSFCWLVAFLAVFNGGATSGAAPAELLLFEQRVRPLLKSYCYDCHGDGSKEGNLALDQFATVEKALESRELWWKVLRNLRSGVMPPAGEKRPSQEELESIAEWIKFGVFGINPQDPDPGRIGVRRLNRREYDNTVDDLLGIKFDASIVFPPDDSGFGFDNVGDALSFSPLLMEKYLRAAQTIVDQTVPKVTWIIPQQEFTGRDFQNSDATLSGERLTSKKPANVKRAVQIDEPGKYEVQVAVRLHGSFDFDPSRYTIVFRIDGQERSTHEYGWDENKVFRYQFIEDWQPGSHELVFELTPLPTPAKVEEQYEGGFGRDATEARFEVNSVRIVGPQGTRKLAHPRNYASFFPREEPPASAAERRRYAEQILRKFATRAFRSPVEQATVDRLVKLAESVYAQEGKTFEAGVSHALVAVLASPRFLFRLESTASKGGEGPFSPIDELALASRLSYFLWSTMPDEELFRLAEAGELRKHLPAQVKRMMSDERSAEFVRNFAGQWLRTRDVTQVSIDPIVVLGYQEAYEKLREQFRGRRRGSFSRTLTPEEAEFRKRFGELREISDRFNDEMKRAMRRETEMCLEYIVQEDRSLLDLLDSDYTFVNEKLASLYEIPNVRGVEMRRVKLPEDSPRGGVLTHASMLLVTSNPTRTSPVKRGQFILENILGMPAPPAPAGVPDLEESAKRFAGREPPLRELLAAHRESTLCASCHARMDPLGIALENFNALGMWRDEEKKQPIDASGKLITGETFQNVRDLKKILRERHASDFYRCVTEKMLTYALGRGLEATDEHTLDLIVRRLIENDGKFSALIQGVVESAPFQKQRTAATLAAVLSDSPALPAGTRKEP
jgi:Protein of unknown function (DUF1592)/Protein of unknown function (DUF1588)/Protein of unknown function (DUF1587)/Protein of unknown function (DUF1585)/Protein of unknown function (DUF1595)/Planctomycete cytochrome C